MSKGTVHKEDIGTAFVCTIKDGNGKIIDVSDATTKEISFLKPSGAKVTKDASFTTDGKDGKIEWITDLVTDLDECGIWKIQGFVVIPTGEWHTTKHSFPVEDNID